MSVGFFPTHKDRQISTIDVVVRYKSKRFKRTSGESVAYKYWSKASQACINTREYPHGSAVNKKLKAIKDACEKACDFFTGELMIPTSLEFWDKVDFFVRGESIHTEVLFLEYYRQYIATMSQRHAKQTIRKHITTLNKLTEYERKRRVSLKFKDIDIQFYRNFEKFIYTYKRETLDGEGNHIEQVGFSANYFGSLIKSIKTVFREAREIDGLHNCTGIDHRDFKVIQETSDTIYLTEEELLRIHDLQFTNELIAEHFPDLIPYPQKIRSKIESCEIVRAKFLIGAFTALRVSDFNRLESVNLKEGFISIRTKKTGAKVVIPIHWVIREILDSGFDIATAISDQKINKHIKEICMMVGINELVEIEKHVGGRRFSETYQKWQLVTNHTARRSGATNMYKAGIPTLSIMKITGHTSEKSFLKYIKITAEENAELLSKHSFFSKK